MKDVITNDIKFSKQQCILAFKLKTLELVSVFSFINDEYQADKY